MASKAVPVPALLAARRRDRARLSRILHDDIAGGLTAAGLSLDLLTLDAPPALSGRIREIQDMLEGSFESVRELSIEVHPDPAIRFGLVPALEKLVRRVELQQCGRVIVSLSEEVAEGLSEEQTRACYEVAEEAMQNVLTHAAAGSIRLTLAFQPPECAFRLAVEDDGAGFDTDFFGGGTGRAIMEDAARRAGLKLTIRSQRGQGSLVEVSGRQG